MCGRLNARLAAAELAATAKLGVAAKLAAGAIVKAASVHASRAQCRWESALKARKREVSRQPIALGVTAERKFTLLYLPLTPLCRE